jgi:hypothetical protein
MEIFKKISDPWFEFVKDNETGMVIGEDIYLCQKIKNAGYKIYVDTGVEVGHLTTMIVNQKTHDLYRAMKCAQQQKNKAMGIF